MTTAFMASSSRRWARSMPRRRNAVYRAATARPHSQTRGDAAIDIELMPVDERRGDARKKNRRADQFVDIAPSAGRRPLFEPGRKGGIVDQRLVQWGLEIARRDRIDLEAVLCPIGAHAASQVLDGSLGRGVGRDAGTRQFALNRRDVDDLAFAARDHVARDGLADIEGA